ncbi:MAG: hypothetical protein RBT62_01375 [Spirochaetia bacterium]|nr:hypothetical protein [Spirochaetia bacterium]
MPFLHLLPALVRRRPGRVELTVSPLTRAIYLGLGVILVLILLRDPAGSPFAIMFAIVIAFATLSEDRWIFDGESGEVRRRYGVLLLAKSWAIGLEMVSTIELDTEFSGADPSDPYAKVNAGTGKDRCAIRLVLSDGRTMVVSSGKAKHLAALRERAVAIAEAISRPLVET